MRYALALPIALAITLCANVARAETAPKTTPPAEAQPPATPAAPAAPSVKETPAKQLFGAVSTPSPLQSRSIGFYARGCLAGAKPLPVDGDAWQAMRLSRNRNWGHPALVRLVERLANDAQKLDGWSGLLVGDMSQPRGGPMLTGHASHQIGLDADIWFTPMPDRKLTEREREDISATSMLGPDKLSVDPSIWTERHARLVKRAVSYPEVERVFVHPAIKKALCEGAAALGPDRSWLSKVRPYWGHYYHFHIRLDCPKDNPDCQRQNSPSHDDGCGKELTDWFALLTAPPKPVKPQPPKPPVTLAQLPPACKLVLESDGTTAAPKAGGSVKKASQASAPTAKKQ